MLYNIDSVNDVFMMHHKTQQIVCILPNWNLLIMEQIKSSHKTHWYLVN